MVDHVKTDDPVADDAISPFGELRMLPLSRIKVVDGFNPRTDVERAEIDQLARSLTERGMLQPVLVQPPDDDGDYPLTDGNRRILAAAQAGIMEVPAYVRTTDQRTGGLDDALIANLGSVRLSPLEEALGFRRLRDARLTAREIAQRVPGVSERVVRERLRILELPEELWPSIADRTIPLGAVEALAGLSAVHPGLPIVAVKRVLDGPAEQWDEPTAWEDLAADPVGVVIGRYDQQLADLPAGVYTAGHGYTVACFTLNEKSSKDLDRLCELLPGVTPDEFTVRFDSALVEQAKALGAAHTSENGYEHIIVGQEVADQLAGDYIAACLKVQRENAKRSGSSPADDAAASDPAGDAADEPVDEAAAKEAARAQRAEEKAAREEAATRNETLGVALVKHLSKVRVDDRVLKVLTAADVGSQLGKIASRGARYGFPGWVQQIERKSGLKREYLAPSEAQAKAIEYLAGARSTTEIAGRTLALVAMARHADETAVAQSQRSFFSLRFTTYGGGDLPWSDQADDLLDELIIEKLPEAVTEPIRLARDERVAKRAEEERRARERDGVVASFVEQAPTMTRDARQEEIQRLRGEYGYTAIPHEVASELMQLAEPGVEPEGDAEEPDADGS